MLPRSGVPSLALAPVLCLFLGLVSMAYGDYPALFPALLSFMAEVNKHNSEEPRSIPRPLSRYDFVIVGAGSAGCVLANRLSEIADWKILLVEAGREESFLMDIPLLANMFQFTDANWKYKSMSSDSYCLGLHKNQCNIPRGKVLGGSSVLNYMIYNRGHHRDYDHWRDLGNPSWGYQDVLPYFLKMEDCQVRPMDREYHSEGGYMCVSDIPTRTPVARAFVNAGEELGFRIIDYNGQYQQGFSFHQVTMKNGTRMSSSRAYLHPIRDRKNLHVLKSAMVTKILIDERTKSATGVEILMRGKKFRVMARKEVILSAGAVNSPQLLMLSGIGPKDHLQKVGIKSLVDLPGVGLNLMDHVALGGMTFLTKPNTTILSDRIMNDPYFLYEFFEHHNGIGSIPGGTEALAFVDLENPEDPDGYPDLELLLTSSTLSGEDTLKENFGIKDSIYNSVYKPLKGKDGFMIFPMVLRPKSKGRIYLKSTNPLTPPLIELGYFKDKQDLDILVKGVRLSMKLIKTKAFRNVEPKLHNVPLPGCKHLTFNSDSYWRCHARHLSFTIYHQSGTCKMGPSSDTSAVLDNWLRVYNVPRLRVVDASMFPEIPASHPNAVILMVAEKASDMIKEDWNRANER